jgi:pilus assembly protein Flp/PilA
MLRTITNRVYLWKNRSRMAEGESGQGLAEYGLILALIALVCVAALGMLGEALAGSPGFQLFD